MSVSAVRVFSDAWKIFTVLCDGGVAIRRVCLLASLFVR